MKETNFHFPGQTGFYRGKVRDVYEIKDKYLVLIATDRISAFDHILPEPIPGKGAMLSDIAAHFLKLTSDIVPNWLIGMPDPRVSVGYKCEAIAIEMVIRGYLCGHALREYQLGKRIICGEKMPDGMKPYQAFPNPLITPSTKAKEGHDEDISKEEILKLGLVAPDIYKQLEDYTFRLFKKGQEYASERGLLLADTKYEFGILNGKITLIDEIHTPDSSRYYYAKGYNEAIETGVTPKQLSKEFVREWLMENGFQGREGETIPEMTPEVVKNIANRYAELYKIVMGKDFDGTKTENNPETLEKIISVYLEKAL